MLLKDFNISSSSSTNDNETTQTLPSCLLPDKEKTSALVRKVLAANPDSNSENRPLLPLPVMNVGMPKCGSTTLFSFFQCAGLRATHWQRKTTDFEGICMRDAANIGLPPIATCASNTEAFMQFDVELPMGFAMPMVFDSKKSRDECFFPQLSLLEELHAENPNLTFVINFRPIHDWVQSVRGWRDMMERFRACHLPNLPRGYPKDLTDTKDVVDTMTQFFCSHVQHIRNFAEAHPSIALIELDLYDNDHSRETLSALFPTDRLLQHTSKCWSHENRSPGDRKKKQSISRLNNKEAKQTN